MQLEQIIGIGIDIESVARVKNLVEKHYGSLEMIFTKDEIEYCDSALREHNRYERYAVRWAAKEAFIKAWPHDDIKIKPNEIGVVHENKKPVFRFYGSLEQAMHKHGYAALLSLSHCLDTATAIVLLVKKLKKAALEES